MSRYISLLLTEMSSASPAMQIGIVASFITIVGFLFSLCSYLWLKVRRLTVTQEIQLARYKAQRDFFEQAWSEEKSYRVKLEDIAKKLEDRVRILSMDFMTYEPKQDSSLSPVNLKTSFYFDFNSTTINPADIKLIDHADTLFLSQRFDEYRSITTPLFERIQPILPQGASILIEANLTVCDGITGNFLQATKSLEKLSQRCIDLKSNGFALLQYVETHAAFILVKQGKHAEAVGRYRILMQNLEIATEKNHPIITSILIQKSYLASKVGNHEEALSLCNKVVDILTKNYNEDHPVVRSAKENLRIALENIKQNEPTRTLQIKREPTRNSMCHCGSGRRFKSCHGAL